MLLRVFSYSTFGNCVAIFATCKLFLVCEFSSSLLSSLVNVSSSSTDAMDCYPLALDNDIMSSKLYTSLSRL